MKLNTDRMIASAREALGWPYVSPGTNNRSGIDCSGLFVKIYRDQGASIYHGSNTIFHEYCSDTGILNAASQLKPGMAVFKLKNWTDSDKGNKWCGREPGNISHIGLVVSVNPLQIIHASSASGCVTTDTSTKNWKYYGRLKDVDYSGGASGGGGAPEPEPTPEPEPEPTFLTATVDAENGKPVKLRQRPSTKCNLYDEIPVGTVVTVTEYRDDWCRVNYRGRQGWYMMTKFLTFG